MQERWYGVIVETIAVPGVDQVGDHGPRPNARRVSGRERTSVDNARKFRTLLLGELGWNAWWLHRGKPGKPKLVEPAEPTIHRASRDIEGLGNVDNSLPVQIAEDSPCSLPLIQATFLLSSLTEPYQCLPSATGPPLGGDSFSGLRSSHDHLLSDRARLILYLAYVNDGSLLQRSCLQ